MKWNKSILMSFCIIENIRKRFKTWKEASWLFNIKYKCILIKKKKKKTIFKWETFMPPFVVIRLIHCLSLFSWFLLPDQINLMPPNENECSSNRTHSMIFNLMEFVFVNKIDNKLSFFQTFFGIFVLCAFVLFCMKLAVFA